MRLDLEHAPSPLPKLTRLDEAILTGLIYADVFDYPLTEEELYERLSLDDTPIGLFRLALRGLTGTFISQRAGYYFLIGREELVYLRQHRERVTSMQWTWAFRYARWLNCIPFIRMVAASGSLAAGNATQDGDIDLFCITEANRLWLARLFIVPMSKISKGLRYRMCPNYLLDRDALALHERDLYTAHEILQVMPIHGEKHYDEFLAANAWTKLLLPNKTTRHRRHRVRDGSVPLLKRWTELLLGGSAGDRLNDAAYRAFMFFYRRRAEKRMWQWEALEPAYQIDRYTVPEGGYACAVRRSFHQRMRVRLGDRVADRQVNALFNGRQSEREPVFYDWDGLFALEYGPHRHNGLNRKVA